MLSILKDSARNFWTVQHSRMAASTFVMFAVEELAA